MSEIRREVLAAVSRARGCRVGDDCDSCARVVDALIAEAEAEGRRKAFVELKTRWLTRIESTHQFFLWLDREVAAMEAP